MAQATTPCPLRCPSGGWRALPNTGTDHCYLFPPRPVPAASFWEYQNYCSSLQPTAYIVSVNSQKEYATGGSEAFKYLLTYVVGTFFVWLGAYYENGQFHWMDGSSWADGYSLPLITNPLDPPVNGTCIYVDPKTTAGTWQYRSCSSPEGATVCEMSPLRKRYQPRVCHCSCSVRILAGPCSSIGNHWLGFFRRHVLTDCSGTSLATTTAAPYTDPDCNKKRMADFAHQQLSGYLGMTELMTLPGKDTSSCATACMYYDDCMSFDISNSGDCRLLGQSAVGMCQSIVPDDTYQHYDMVQKS